MVSLLAASSAHALDVVPSGSVVVRFTSNPATCAAEGLCGRAGSMSWRPAHTPDTLDTSEGFLDLLGDPPVVRSSRLTGGGHGVCIDTAPEPFGLSVTKLRTGRVVISMRREDVAGLGFGRCAGPLTADFHAALPESVPVSLPAVRRGARIDMTGHRTFSAGAFSGSVDSSLVLRHSRTTSGVTQVTSTSDSTSAQPPRGPREWIGMLALKYQIERITGDTGVGYSGVPGFGCEPFDSCGLAGDLTLHADLGAGVLTVGSYRRLPAHGHEHMASALRALHSGQAPASADATFRPPAGANSFPDNQGVALPVTETAGFADSPPCRETSHLVAAGLTSRRSGAGLRISLSVAGNQFPDPLRTRCPGPATADIGDLAAGILPLATLGNPTPPLVLRPPPAVTAPGYRGGGHGGLTVALRLVSRNVATRVIRKERFLP